MLLVFLLYLLIFIAVLLSVIAKKVINYTLTMQDVFEDRGGGKGVISHWTFFIFFNLSFKNHTINNNY